MLVFLGKRAGYYVVLLLVALFISYALASASMNPRAYFEGRQPRPSAASVEAHLTELGVNDHTPFVRRFGSWAAGVVTGDLGQTIDDTSVNDEFGRRIGVSLRLLLIGTIVGTVVGVLAGAWGAVRQYRFSDRAITVISFVLLSTPIFLLATLLKIGTTWLNANVVHLIDFTGEKSPGLQGGFFTQFGDRAAHLLLPTLSIALGTIAAYSRYQRATMLDVLGSDYLRTALAKGLHPRRALLRHGLRTALVPMTTFFAFGFLGVFTGAAFTERIFGWHGMGDWFMESVAKNDVNSVVAVNLFAAVVILLSGFLADLMHAALDPRVRI
ncbi:ABC transporter permease [Streptosporangium sp. NBC_01756]|uniref:ABC transporter permease n=1 Tax=Streptosporangium sp. NBC_01756 TaxID=2975950 RepID=UPI002DDB00C2|nr:ABC transporter permease [Streptosporangium sp. NBC_01756]WSC87532.1 ABC transporter permease [Streptosporangium sp. NBC_01756]